MTVSEQLALQVQTKKADNRVGIGRYFHSADLLSRQVDGVIIARTICESVRQMSAADEYIQM